MRLLPCFRGFAPLFAISSLALLACVSLTFAQQREQGEKANPLKAAPGGVFRIELGQEEREEKPAAQEAGYWIGIACIPAEEELREKLEIKSGLLVLQVLEQGPAAKSGLKRGDAITAVNGKPVGELAQLAAAVGASQGKTLKLEIVREGKSQTIEVHPAKRPAEFAEEEDEKDEKAERKEREKEETEEKAERKEKREAGEEREENEERERAEAARRVWQQLESLRKAQAGQGIVIRPQGGAPGSAVGVAVPAGRLPDDMEVTIQKRGNKPVRVTVKQGEKLWRTTENELGMLPAEAQGYVKGLLGRGPAQVGAMPRPGALILDGPQGGLRIEIREGNEKAGPEVRRIEIREGREENEKKEPEVQRFRFSIPETKSER